MSGIAGYLGRTEHPAVLQAMVRSISHRGRDGEGFHEADPVFMGVRMSDGGDAQPIYNETRNAVVIFSGDLPDRVRERETLERKGFIFRNGSDGEIILHLYKAYGLNGINHLRGAFAFALHDMEKDLVFIGRDHMGVQPLYYATTQSGSFVFASEIKAILEHPSMSVVPDMAGIDAYLTLGYSPASAGLFKGIHKLPAGHRIIWNPGLHAMVEPYWSMENKPPATSKLRHDADFQARFDMILEKSVALSVAGQRMPGVFLTGGAGSAAIAAAMAKYGTGKLHAFSVGYSGDQKELVASRAVAEHLGAEYHEAICYPADMEILPELIWAMDEPVVDPGIVPMHLLAKLARQKTTKALSGKGANDLMGGRHAHKTLMDAYRLPTFSYTLLKPAMKFMPASLLGRFSGSDGRQGARSRQRMADFIDSMRRADLNEQYASLMALFTRRDKHALYGTALDAVMDAFLDMQREGRPWPTFLSTLFALEMRQGVMDDMLTTFDKVTMLKSLEGTLPFMDYAMVEFMMSVPDRLKYDKGRDKILLRNYAAEALNGLPDLPSTGVFPIERYLSARPLRDMLETCLSEDSIKKRGLFRWSAVKVLLQQAKEGDAVPARQVFGLLTLELWFRIYVDRERGWISK